MTDILDFSGAKTRKLSVTFADEVQVDDTDEDDGEDEVLLMMKRTPPARE
jgi:hypothetical protein